MEAGERRPSDDDLRRYLVARADAASRGAGADMVERVAVGLGVLRGSRARTGNRAVRLAVVAAVMLATLLAIGFGTGVLPPPIPSPTPGPTRDPAATAAALQALPTATYPGAGQIAADATSVWVADRTGGLAELDPASGTVLRTVDLPRLASDVLITADSVWVSSDVGPLVRVDRTTLAITEVQAAVGVAIAAGRSGIWLGGTNEVIRIDPATNAISLRVPIPERAADLGVAVTDGAVWVATRTQILQLDPGNGSVRASIAGDATGLVLANGAVWATRGTELLRIDPARAEVTAFVPGFPGGIALAATEDHVWVGGPPGGGGSGAVLGASTLDGWIELTGVLPASVLDVAAATGTLWITPDEDAPGELAYRFAIP